MPQSEIVHDPKEVNFIPSSRPIRYYRHGWQSWSLTTWHDLDQHIPTPKPTILHPLQTDPGYVHESRPHGSWVGAVEMESGLFFLLGALDFDAHIFLEDNTLVGKYENKAGIGSLLRGAKKRFFNGDAYPPSRVLAGAF